jgi:hypothetical protein
MYTVANKEVSSPFRESNPGYLPAAVPVVIRLPSSAFLVTVTFDSNRLTSDLYEQLLKNATYNPHPMMFQNAHHHHSKK